MELSSFFDGGDFDGADNDHNERYNERGAGAAGGDYIEDSPVDEISKLFGDLQSNVFSDFQCDKARYEYEICAAEEACIVHHYYAIQRSEHCVFLRYILTCTVLLQR